MDLDKLSKECSYILRPALEKYHLKSDSHGWVCIDSFIDVSRMKFGWSDIHNVILNSPKKVMKLVQAESGLYMDIQLISLFNTILKSPQSIYIMVHLVKIKYLS
ncbi:RNA 2'-phosphotransferase [Streptococcus cuniculi]|nr:RNA 2'-phosphotransferase [Streptococcus cuniculi]MBF0778968.1 RNA 2'-phosphotransferase [Streptococcus cuniculi]